MRSVAATLCLLSIAAVHAEVRDMKLPTAEDGEITYRVDNAARQAENAKDDRAETLPVTTSFVPRRQNAGVQWTFVYRVRFKEGAKPVAIRVESENPGAIKLEVEEKLPKLHDGVWAANVKPIDFNRFWAEKISAKDPWMLQRRYTIVYADGRKSVLHQLSILTQEGRAQMVQTMRQ